MANEMVTTGTIVEIMPRADTFDNNGGWTCLRSLGNFLRWLVALRGIVLSCLTNDDAGDQSADDGERQSEPVLDAQQVKDGKCGDGDEHGAYVGSQTERAKQILHGCSLLGANQEDSDKREEYSDGCDDHRSYDGLQLHVAVHGESRGAEGGSRKD